MWILRVEPWSGVLDWILQWNEVRFGVLGQNLVLIDQFLTVHFALDSLCFFCQVSLTCFNQALNICFIIGRQL